MKERTVTLTLNSVDFENLNDPKNTEIHKMASLRTGGFHVECIFMSVIAKMFLEAGLKDLVVEAGLLTKVALCIHWTRHIINAIRVHKYVVEAMVRYKLNVFELWLVVI